MKKLNMERLPDGRWSDEDIQRVWDIVFKRGLPWAREQVSSMPQLNQEQEIAIGEALDNELQFYGDNIAVEIGIPSREERDWTDEEIDIIWAELKDRMRPSLIARILNPDADPATFL